MEKRKGKVNVVVIFTKHIDRLRINQLDGKDPLSLMPEGKTKGPAIVVVNNNNNV